jgi:hypothetical protein
MGITLRRFNPLFLMFGLEPIFVIFGFWQRPEKPVFE